jgi:hypothetical protein
VVAPSGGGRGGRKGKNHNRISRLTGSDPGCMKVDPSDEPPPDQRRVGSSPMAQSSSWMLG